MPSAPLKAACAHVDFDMHTQEFPLFVWQTGSRTQTNMNLNDVFPTVMQPALALQHITAEEFDRWFRSTDMVGGSGS